MCVALAAFSAPLTAQAGGVASIEARLRALQAEAARAARERDSLQSVLRRLESSFRDMSAEAQNLQQQADATVRAVNAFDRQLRTLNEEVASASGSLVRAQDELVLKQATLNHRLVDIYKRGPLYSFEALLSAESFGQLVTRYKYLRTLALRDRALVKRCEELRNDVSGKRDLILVLQTDIVASRTQKAEEEQRLRGLERQWQQRAALTQRNKDVALRTLARREADKKRLDDAVAALIAERRRGETRAPAAAAAPGFRPADRNTLNWPVDGDVLYSFGRVKNPDNTMIRWDGVGIGAPAGTPVRAVAPGVVQVAESMGGYGLCVLILHGEMWSSYCGLGRVTVGKGQSVEKGEQIGTVGTMDTELGAHLHFQIRDPEGHAVDPLEWLRRRQ